LSSVTELKIWKITQPEKPKLDISLALVFARFKKK
jgi:hypothetical protein